VPDALADLRARLAEVSDLNRAAAVLEWDQETHMPTGAADARAHQIGTLRHLAHERLTAPEVGGLLDALVDAFDDRPEEDPDRALVRVARRDRARATRLPGAWVTAFAEATSRAREAWKAAREADDFSASAPHLRRVVELNVEKADRLRPLVAEERGPGYAPSEADARYDALLDEFEAGATTADVSAAFDGLRAGLVPLVGAIAQRPAPDDAVLRKSFPEEAQWALGLEVARAFGYDLNHGRQDRSAHPFSTALAITDVRITTRLDPRFFPSAFFGTLHETGHALYEQGIDLTLDRTPLADGASLGLHESQSRLWENLVGRSRPFWNTWMPRAQAAFPEALGGVDAEAMYRAVNVVRPSLIRVEADELTYHLHVLLRFEVERALLAGSLDVADVPEAWNEAMRRTLGVVPPSDADGCLQDIHWSLGALGYFPTYTLGTLMSVQLFDAARRDVPDLDGALAGGDYAPLLGWLRAHVHRYGRSLPAPEILRRATGQGLSAGPWLAYARVKYGELYGLSEG
jgi:carboxypeptidase Taq